MACVFCATDWHEICLDPTEQQECCCFYVEPKPELKVGLNLAVPAPASTTVIKYLANKVDLVKVKRQPGNYNLNRPHSETVSSGRKRADHAAPMFDGMQCEWAGLKFAGGGVIPIVACRPGEQASARHHGPDKSTMNNELKINLHRICSKCHSRWHTRNDEYYGARLSNKEPFVPKGGLPCIPHDPVTMATEEDFAASDLYWSDKRPNRPKPELEPEPEIEDENDEDE